VKTFALTAAAVALSAVLCAALCAATRSAAEHRDAFGRLPGAPEVVYLPAKYAACLRCHPRELPEEEDFNVETGFRDMVLGKNLHGLHVFRQPRGTNCTGCHVLDPRTDNVVFSPAAGVSLDAAGGRCAPTCHRPKTYRNAGRPPSRP